METKYTWRINLIGEIPTIERFHLVERTKTNVIVKYKGRINKLKTNSKYYSIYFSEHEAEIAYIKLLDQRMSKLNDKLEKMRKSLFDPVIVEMEEELPEYLKKPLILKDDQL